MRQHLLGVIIAAVLVVSPALTVDASASDLSVQLGPRPFYLVEKMSPSPLKSALQQCGDDSFKQSTFSIGQRGGGALQFPEHTKESHEAGARMGAGVLECDVTFTRDGQLVCRHDQCDLHTTTNILVTDLAQKCSVPFSPAVFDPATGARTRAASALCCTSDLTLTEFKSLKGKMDASNPNATTPREFLGGTANWRTDLYSTGGTLLSHKESIQLIKSLGAKFTPELKGPNRSAKLQVEAVFGSQEGYAQAMIDDYKAARIAPNDVFAQSFSLADVLYWIKREPKFGKQAVYLDDANTPSELPTLAELKALKAQGVKIVAPPLWALLTVDGHGNIVPSQYALNAKAANLEIITWTLERSGRIVEEVLPTKVTLDGSAPTGPLALDGVRVISFTVEPNRTQLVELARLVDGSVVAPIVEDVFPLAQARAAFQRDAEGNTRGKLVLGMVDGERGTGNGGGRSRAAARRFIDRGESWSPAMNAACQSKRMSRRVNDPPAGRGRRQQVRRDR